MTCQTKKQYPISLTKDIRFCFEDCNFHYIDILFAKIIPTLCFHWLISNQESVVTYTDFNLGSRNSNRDSILISTTLLEEVIEPF